MKNPTLQEKLTLIKNKALLPHAIKEQFPKADFATLLDTLSQSVETLDQQVGNAPPGVQTITDPLKLRDIDLNGMGPDLNSFSPPELDEEVDRDINQVNQLAAASLYFLYQHEMLGIFEVFEAIQRDFRFGALRINIGQSAAMLYQEKLKSLVRPPAQGRHLLYRRLFNYGPLAAPAGTPVNRDFHKLLLNFIQAVNRFYRDQRISEVIRKGGSGMESSFGSMEAVRQAGIDLRNSIHRYAWGETFFGVWEATSYFKSVIEIMKLPDMQLCYNVKSEWELIEKVGETRLNKAEKASVRGTMAQEGKKILEWLIGDAILETRAIPFEMSLNAVGQSAERWLICYKNLNKP